MKKFTEEELILYLYNECSPKLRATIEAASQDDVELNDRIQILKRTLQQLDKLKLSSPSKQSIKRILQHAKKAK